MGKFLVDLIIYTFSVFGIVYYFNCAINSLKRRVYQAKIIFLLEDYKDIELILSDIRNYIINNNISNDIYISVNQKNNCEIDLLKNQVYNSKLFKVIDRNQLISMIGNGVIG